MAIPSYHDVVIRVINLKKNFGELRAVDGLSFEIYRGEIFGFLGPNGAGKTTSINMICGLLEPSDGDIAFLNNQNNGKDKIRQHIGICPQDNIIWPKLTCLEQLVFMGEMYGMSSKSAREKSKILLASLALESKSKVLAGKLSGGLKRRLNICLALIHDPDILILDEPEAGLDPQSRIMVRNFIKNLANQKTIILTTHNMDEADRLSDRVAIIDFGKLLLLDTPENLKRSMGTGDVLEIELDSEPQDKTELLLSKIKDLSEDVSNVGRKLIIKAKNVINLISQITAAINKNGFKITEMTVRENTLEDVFIHLTGRKLRQ